MARRVVIAADARADIVAIYAYIAEHESPDRAERVLVTLEAACASLDEQSLRGHVPAEMRLLGVTDYLEIYAGRYRLVYTVSDDEVVVYGVADGRRDMQGFLARRLSRP